MNAPVSRDGVVGPGDAVVEQAPARDQLVPHEREVRRVVADADVLGEPDRAHRVEPGVAHVAVVAEPDLRRGIEALPLDRLLGPGGLLPRQRHADHLDAVVLGRVPDHPAPAGPDVEQPHARLEAELAGDQVVLRELRLLQRGLLGREAGAGVGHRRPEDHLVEPVRDVVVVVDRPGVAAPGVPEALDEPAPLGQRLLRRRGRRLEPAPAEPPGDLERLRRRRDLEPRLPLEQHHRRVGVAGVHAGQGQVAGDVGAGHARGRRAR